jgi:dephospho-CoA kinase
VIKLSLIGMSGAGKSHWAQKLAAAGFRVISIDDRIEEKLAPELGGGRLPRHWRSRGMDGMAGPTNLSRARTEISGCEVESMNEALDEIERLG